MNEPAGTQKGKGVKVLQLAANARKKGGAPPQPLKKKLKVSVVRDNQLEVWAAQTNNAGGGGSAPTQGRRFSPTNDNMLLKKTTATKKAEQGSGRPPKQEEVDRNSLRGPWMATNQ